MKSIFTPPTHASPIAVMIVSLIFLAPCVALSDCSEEKQTAVFILEGIAVTSAVTGGWENFAGKNLAKAGAPDLQMLTAAELESLRSTSERFELSETVFYLHAPDGIARSKLASNVEKALGVVMTSRNWRSVNAVMSLALEVAE